MVPLALNILCKICAQVSKKNPWDTDWVEMLLFAASNSKSKSAKEVMLRECQMPSLSSASNFSCSTWNYCCWPANTSALFWSNFFETFSLHLFPLGLLLCLLWTCKLTWTFVFFNDTFRLNNLQTESTQKSLSTSKQQSFILGNLLHKFLMQVSFLWQPIVSH